MSFWNIEPACHRPKGQTGSWLACIRTTGARSSFIGNDDWTGIVRDDARATAPPLLPLPIYNSRQCVRRTLDVILSPKKAQQKERKNRKRKEQLLYKKRPYQTRPIRMMSFCPAFPSSSSWPDSVFLLRADWCLSVGPLNHRFLPVCTKIVFGRRSDRQW